MDMDESSDVFPVDASGNNVEGSMDVRHQVTVVDSVQQMNGYMLDMSHIMLHDPHTPHFHAVQPTTLACTSASLSPSSPSPNATNTRHQQVYCHRIFTDKTPTSPRH